MIVSMIFYYFAIFLYTRSDANPCLSTNHVILDDEWRSTDNVITSLGDAHCDATMIETWYRVNHGILGNIATSAPALDSCGTQYPVWMDDDLPGAGSTSSVKMCLRTMFSVCQATWTIDVKNCSTFYVYDLKQSTVCSSAYCFDPGSPTTTTTTATTTSDTTTTATTTSDTTTTATTTSDTTTTATTTSDTTTTATTTSDTTTTATTTSDTTTTATTTSDTTTTATTTSDTTTTTEATTTTSDTTTTPTTEATTATITTITAELTTTISLNKGQYAVHEGMTTGAVIGIAFAMLILLVIIVVVILFIFDKINSISRSNNVVDSQVDTVNENPTDERGAIKLHGMPP